MIFNEETGTWAGMETIEGGGVTSAPGFKAGGIHAGFRKNSDKRDLALLAGGDLCVAAGVFTQNIFCAAPVQLCRERLVAVWPAEVGGNGQIRADSVSFCRPRRARLPWARDKRG